MYKSFCTLLALAFLTFSTACGLASTPLEDMIPQGQVVPPEETVDRRKVETAAAKTLPEVAIVQKYIKITNKRYELIREYSKIHYGREILNITPKAVVVHWTVSNDWESVYDYFYNETGTDDEGGSLNVSSQFLVARDGTIYQLTPETLLNRHAIGLNWCAIGIENVGGVGGEEDLTEAQLQANIKLITYLHAKYPTITNVLGHYQQVYAKNTDLWREDMADYYADKIDPGPSFMRSLRIALSPLGLHFFQE